jgi:hypothetical protein
MLRPRVNFAIALVFAALIGLALGDVADENLASNPSAEEVADGKPVGWGMYRGKGKASWGASEEAHTGQRSAVLRIEGFGEWQGQPFVNAGLLAADSNGYDGSRALSAKPATDYHFSFWMKGTVPWVQISAYVWSSEQGQADMRSSVGTTLARLEPTADWQRYEGTLTTRADSRRFALHFHVFGHQTQGMTTGMLWIDDVSIAAGESVPETPPPKRIVLPAEFHPFIEGRGIEELRRAFRAGEADATELVAAKLERADTWADKSDSWFLHRTASFTPVGLWTLACPFHPSRVRDFSPDNFEWSIDDPWKLVCPLCKAEGREPCTYPNERYPDDGTGCYPTDGVWREDHDEAWGQAQGGIPWERWDGKPHGYSAAGYCYYFLGKCAHLIMTYECTDILPALAEGYVIARHVLPADDPRSQKASRYARRVKVAMLCRARAHLGDEYLANAIGLGEAEYDDALARFYNDDPEGLAKRRFPGYTPYGLQDGIEGDPKHRPRGRPDIYADGSYRGDLYAREWLRAYAFVRDTYTQDEEGIQQMTERILVSHEGDAKALESVGQPVKKGKLEYALRPYDMTVGHSDNLGGRELATKFDFGRLLGDEAAVDAVVSNVQCYLRNYFSGDGLGREGSGAYTNCAWNTLSQVLDRLHGYRGHYDEAHPWWDPELQALNPCRDPYLRAARPKLVLSLYPDGRLIPWMDSHVDGRLALEYIEQVANDGEGLPEAYAPFFEVTRDEDDRVAVRPREPLDLPSILHHELRKALLRSGTGDRQTVLGIDYALNSGHWHPAPMDLILFAYGQELASDLGYFGAMSSLTQDWIRTCEAHNTCIVRSDDGDHQFLHEAQGDIYDVIDLRHKVQVVEVAERRLDKLSLIPGEKPRYERTTALVALDEAHPYAVDIFRVRGGAIHDYMFHSQGRACEVDGLALQPRDDRAESLFQASGFTFPKRPGYGSDAIRELRHGRADGSFSLTWTDVPDWDNDGQVAEGVGLRLTMLGRGGTQVWLGAGPGQRRMSNADLGEKLHVACVRRENTEALDTFVAVIEPYRDSPFVREVRALSVEGAPDAVAVEIVRPDRTDLVLSKPTQAPEDRIPCQVAGTTPFETDAAFVVVSSADGQVRYVQAVGGSFAAVNGKRLELGGAYAARLLSFDDTRHVLTVESASGLPEGETLRDAVMVLRHERGTSTLTIESVRKLDGSRYDIALRWAPHLGENYLRVVGKEGNWLRLQPPPSLPHGFENLGYQAYVAGAGDERGFLGRIERREGEWYRPAGGRADVGVGGEVMLTRLRAGQDTIRIPNCAAFEG